MDDQIARLLLLAKAEILTGVERGIAYGTPALRVRGKFLARMKDATTLVISCPLWEKAMLMETEPEFYFETDHYTGYAAMLVHLHVIDDARLAARLEAAWKMQAGSRMFATREASLKARELPWMNPASPQPRDSGVEVFLVLFYKKELLASCL